MTGLSLIVLLFGGWGLCTLLLPDEKSVSRIAAYSWLLGAILVSVTLALLGIVISGRVLVAAVTLITLSPGFVALRKIHAKPAWHPPRGLAEWALCAAIVCQCALLLRFALTTALDWDGLMVWEIKARIAFLNGGALPPDYFTDVARSWSHPEYPLMLPMLETWIYLWIGETSQFLVRIIFPCFYLAALLLIYSEVAETSGKRSTGLLTAALLFFIPFLTAGQVNVFTGYADFPLACFYLAAVACLLRWLRSFDVSQAIAFGIFAGALPWTKREGTLLWGCIMLVAVPALLIRRDARIALRVSAPGLVAIVGWRLVLFLTKALPNQDFMPLTLGNLTGHLDRAGTILHEVGYWLGSIDTWSLLWILFPVALAWIVIRGERNLAMPLCASVVMPLALYASVYILSSWASVESHIDCSLPRLISHVALVALLTLGIALGIPAAKS